MKRTLLKDKKIEILKEVTIIDDEGIQRKSTLPIHTGKLWAFVRWLSGSERAIASGMQSTEEFQFVINWRNDLTTQNFIRYKDKLYHITRIDTFEDH